MADISSVGHTWEDVRSKIFTPEVMAESDLRIALIGELIKARQERGITQRELEKMSGVRQPGYEHSQKNIADILEESGNESHHASEERLFSDEA